jgi:hypothetical protein
MDTELIKLRTKQETSSRANSKFIKETFLKACINLDVAVFEPLIDEDQYFQDLDKYRFLHSIKKQFDYLKGKGVKKVELVMGTCKACFNGEVVHEFYVVPEVGKPVFAFNIQEVQGEIKDIFRCNYSDGYEREAKKNRDPNLNWIDYD